MERRRALDWGRWCVRGTSIRAQHAAAGARRTGAPAAEPADHALGRSRGGWGTKVHLACDGQGTITASQLTAGQVNECTQVAALLDPLRIGRRRRPRQLLGDLAYSTRAIRAWARQRHVHFVMPERVDQIEQRSHRPGRQSRFEHETYRTRNVVERAADWLKRWRRNATRSEKLAICFRAAICLVLAATYAARHFSDTTYRRSRDLIGDWSPSGTAGWLPPPRQRRSIRPWRSTATRRYPRSPQLGECSGVIRAGPRAGNVASRCRESFATRTTSAPRRASFGTSTAATTRLRVPPPTKAYAGSLGTVPASSPNSRCTAYSRSSACFGASSSSPLSRCSRTQWPTRASRSS